MLAWIPLFPLMGFLINGFWYAFFQSKPTQKKMGTTVVGIIATASIFMSFVFSVLLFGNLYSLPEGSRVIEQILFTWMQIGALNIDLGLRIDVLSALFSLVITGVGTLIHLYSIGYMHEDETPGKYFAYLNLFCFAMLMLVLGSSLPVLFLGWEGVGLCSYLLIGYWYSDNEKASAGKKAFIVNRIGDFGFLIGMFLIYSHFNTLDFVQLKSADLTQIQPLIITAICLFLFLGCTGKSAQIPLYVWLPDAMAGPTPVSALIHAATMVTSGIYLVTRLNFFYLASPAAMEVVAWVGVLTAFFAATIAFVQRDIKKVLAYSTVSQLGYMFLGCGVGAFGAGVFHVITHAFFKALLFLGAGSVIHGMHHEQDIMKMGGLKSKMPKTYLTFAIGWLAICGLPPFSGFFSKDEILWLAFSSPHGSVALWGVAALTAVMTAFYMTRLFSLTFFGKFRGDHHHEVHESPATMIIPLGVLAALSALGGFIGIPHISWLAHWLEPVVHHDTASTVSHSMEWVLMAMSVAGALLGIVFAWNFYKDLSRPQSLREKLSLWHKLLENKWFVDEIYNLAFVKTIFKLSHGLWKKIDVHVIDWTVLAFGRVSLWTGQTARLIQTGSLQVYGIVFLFGILIFLGYLIYGMA